MQPPLATGDEHVGGSDPLPSRTPCPELQSPPWERHLSALAALLASLFPPAPRIGELGSWPGS